MDQHQAAMTALAVPYGTEQYMLAVNICDLRGINPDFQRQTHSGLVMTQWQMVVLEQLLCRQLGMILPA